MGSKASLALAGVWLAVCAAGPAQGQVGMPGPDAVRARMRSELAWRRYAAALADFSVLEKEGFAGGGDFYAAALAYFELSEPEKAEPPLARAAAAGYPGPAGGMSSKDFAEKLRQIRRLSPPLAAQSPPGIATYAAATPWSQAVVAALPSYAAAGREVFGSSAPALRLYIFADRPSFDQFWEAALPGHPRMLWQDGTGGSRLAVFCEKDAFGAATRQTGVDESLDAVLHELGHAWAGTYVRDLHDQDLFASAAAAAWAMEGLADFVAALRDEDYFTRRQAWVRNRVAQGLFPPNFADLSDRRYFYETGSVFYNYALSALLFRRLLGKDGAARIPRLLDALISSEDAEKAFLEATGKSPAEEYQNLVKELLAPPEPAPALPPPQ